VTVPGNTAPSAATPAAAPVEQPPARPATIAAAANTSDAAPSPPASGKLTRERFIATQKWLPSAAGEQYSIQLLTVGIRDLRRIEDVLLRVPARKLQMADFYVYSVKINDQQHYRLAYGLYPSAEDANKAMRELPSVYRSFIPFHRSVERMRSQNRQ